VSEEKLLYKQFIDDQDSETFEEFLIKRLNRAENAASDYKSILEAIVDAAKILDHAESSNSVQLKHFAEFARDKAMKALGR
jgi:tRNA(Met) C34 N-acetyltransferase TmcA